MRHTALFALTLLCASCSDQASAPAAQGDMASGEVLGGTISDAMIPLEQLTSQAPLAPRQGPSASDIDAQQPAVAPMLGVEDAAPVTGAEAAPAAPAPTE